MRKGNAEAQRGAEIHGEGQKEGPLGSFGYRNNAEACASGSCASGDGSVDLKFIVI